MSIPVVKRDESFVEEIHNMKIADPYRWLEDPDSEETKDFVKAQNEYTFKYINQCPIKDRLKESLTKMWNYPKYSCPYKRANKYFYFKNSGLQNQSVMYVKDSLDGESSVFLDVNKLSEDGTTSISGTAFSEDGGVFAYGLSKRGSDWVSLHFKNVETGEDYPESLEKVKFTNITWSHDHKGIFYSCFPDSVTEKTTGAETNANENQKLYYHFLGTPQSEDILIAEFPEHPNWRIEADVSHCGKYVILIIWAETDENLLYFAHIPEKITSKLELTNVVDKFEHKYDYVTNTEKEFIFLTNKDAPNYKLLKINFDNPSPENWTTLLEENKDQVLEWATCIDNDKLVVCSLKHVTNILEVRRLIDAEHIYTFPTELGSIAGYSGKRFHSEMFYSHTSFLSPSTIYRVDFNKPLEPTIFQETKVEGFDLNDYETKQIFYTSKDGIKIPMFIVHSKDFEKGSERPLLLYGYGGFNISITPTFSISRLLFMKELKGAYAIPNIRGGGEYGQKWHDAGRALNRKNVFDDFIAATEYLIDNNYVKKEKIVINGYSNGGLLVGASINKRPDLFGAAVAGVGVFDMLRFHKFTIGSAWCGDYGDPDKEEHFKYNLSYSPLHNVNPPSEGVQYPAILLTTADHDDRVVPLHSLKMISELQHKISSLPWQKNPIIIRIETKAGHGHGKSTSQVIDEMVDKYSFIYNALHLGENED